MSLRWIWFTLGSVHRCSPSLLSFHSFFSVALRGGAAGSWHVFTLATGTLFQRASSGSYLSFVWLTPGVEPQRAWRVHAQTLEEGLRLAAPRMSVRNVACPDFCVVHLRAPRSRPQHYLRRVCVESFIEELGRQRSYPFRFRSEVFPESSSGISSK